MRDPLRSRTALLAVAAVTVTFSLHFVGAPASADTTPVAATSTNTEPASPSPAPASTPGPASTPAPASTSPAPGATAAPATTPAATPVPGAGAPVAAAPKAKRAHGRHHAHRRHHGRAGGLALSVRHDGKVVLAHAAAGFSDSIIDFAFSPATLTVHVGDTVTWTNTGQQPHTATANNGSFDTPILQHGQSASHTFTTAGSFSYYCKVHPYMKATITVVAATTSGGSTHTTSAGSTGQSSGTNNTSTPGSTTSGANTTSSNTAANTTSSGSTLPLTGVDLGSVLAVGLALTAGGLVLRRRLGASS